MGLRIIPLSGVEEVGKNCTILEFNSEIIIIDLGLDFPNQDMPGIDYLLPDITYLEKNKKRIKGLVLTHGHLDHIGGIPYVLERLGNPRIFATPLTMGLVQDRLSEVGFKKPNLNLINPDHSFSLGSFKINPFRVVHNIPDSVGLIIETPLGVVVCTGDFKFDNHPVDQKPLEEEKLRHFAKKGVLVLLSDSTNATLPGKTVSEKDVGEVIEKIIRNAHNSRVIFTTFSTLISRIQQLIYAARKNNRKIALVGYSIKKNIQIARDLGYLNVSSADFIDLNKPEDIDNYPNNRIIILAAGAQGVEGSSMAKISENKHWLIKIRRGDTIVMSSSTIPGNEFAVHQMMDGLIDQGAKIIYQAGLGLGLHSSGHAYQEDLKMMIKIVRPKFFIPVHGEHYMQAEHIELAKEMGIKKENCFMLFNGEVLEIDDLKRAKVAPKKNLANSLMVVESDKVVILNEETMKLRQRMAESGVCALLISHQDKNKLNIEIVFSGLSIETTLMEEIKNKVRRLVKKYGFNNQAREKIKISLSDFLLNKTGKRPAIILFVS
jgi:ribonuclease J